MLSRSVVAVGVCANATLASNAEAARLAMVYLANISVLPVLKIDTGKTLHVDKGSEDCKRNKQSEATPVWRYAIIAMQLCFLRTVAPIEILVRAERRRVFQLVIVDVEFVRLEPHIVAKATPGQRKQVRSHAKEPAETKDGVRYLAGDLVDHQSLDVADHIAVRPSHRGAFNTIARDQLVWSAQDVRHHHLPFGLMK